MRILLLALALAFGPGDWGIAPTFSVKWNTTGDAAGIFKGLSGTIHFDETNLATASFNVSIKVATLNTGNGLMNTHAKSAEYLDATKYPEITFSSTSIEKVDDETVKITGDLTLHGETHPVELEAEIGGVETGPEGETRTGLEVTGTLSRKEWGMTFNGTLGSGNVVVSDKVKLTLDIAAVLDEG